MSQFQNGDVLRIDSGTYQVSKRFSVNIYDGCTYDNNQNYTIIGSGSDQTTIETTYNVSQLFYFYLSSSYNAYFTLKRLTYRPYYGGDEDLGYFRYVDQLVFADLVIDGSQTDGYTYNDLVYAYYTDSVIVDNMEIYDFNRRSHHFILRMTSDGVLMLQQEY